MATKKAGSNNLYDTNGDVIGFVDDDGGEVYFARVVDGSLMGPDGAISVGGGSGQVSGMDPSNTAAANATALQAALTAGGLVQITTPGTYLIGSGPDADANTCFYVDSDTTVYLGPGVILKQTTGSRTLFINRNWKSNAVAVTAVVYAYDTPTTGVGTMTVNTGTVSAGLAVDEYAYIKNDTANVINGVFKVLSIDESDTNNRKFTVRLYGAHTSKPYAAYAGTPDVYKADANITFKGEGLIDYDFKGSSGTNAMGTVMNKVGYLNWHIATANSVKYGIYAGNIFVFNGGAPRAFSPSNNIQFIGPAWHITLEDFAGDAGDDPYAITTSNAGYTAYDMTDADTTKNTDGPVYGVRIKTLHTLGRMIGRGVLIAASNDGDVYDIDIDHVSGGESAIRNSVVQFGIPAGHTGAIRGLKIGHIDAVVDSSSPPVLSLVESGTGVLSVYGCQIDSVVARKAAGSNGTQNHLVYIGTSAGQVNVSIGLLSCDFDISGSSNMAAVYATGAGNHNVLVDSIVMNTAGTATRQAYGVLSAETTTASKYLIGKIKGVGSNVTGVGGFFDNNVFQVNDVQLNGQSSTGINANKLVKASFGSIACLAGTETAFANIYGGSGTSELHVGSARGFVQFFSNMSATNLRFSLGGGFFSGIGTVTGDLMLMSTVIAGNLNNLDGTAHLHATVSNHAPGAMFYNSNAGWGSGVGTYVRGATAWVLVAA